MDAGCLPAGELIPADETHVHLADGASEAELTLPAGEHTLCLQAGDGQHAALALTDEITITVAGAESMTTTLVDGREVEVSQAWHGAYEGRVLLECSPGDVFGTLEANVAVFAAVFAGGNDWLRAEHTTTGSCLGPDVGSRTGIVMKAAREPPPDSCSPQGRPMACQGRSPSESTATECGARSAATSRDRAPAR